VVAYICFKDLKLNSISKRGVQQSKKDCKLLFLIPFSKNTRCIKIKSETGREK